MREEKSIDDFVSTKGRYNEYRSLIYEMATQEFSALGIECREISFSDARQADSWSMQWAHKERAPTWEWVQQYHVCQGKNSIKRFDLAVYANGQLQGLCYGLPTKRKLTLKLHTLARNPINNPLAGRILNIILAAAYDYAQLLNCKEIWVMNPSNERLVTLYQSMDYTVTRNKLGMATHLALEVKYEQG